MGKLRIDLRLMSGRWTTNAFCFFFYNFFSGFLFLFTIWNVRHNGMGQNFAHAQSLPLLGLCSIHGPSRRRLLRFLCALSSVPTGIFLGHASTYMRLQEPLGILGLRTLSLQTGSVSPHGIPGVIFDLGAFPGGILSVPTGVVLHR